VYEPERVGKELVFPTCVGMNRPWQRRQSSRRCVPHMRGDEPILVYVVDELA